MKKKQLLTKFQIKQSLKEESDYYDRIKEQERLDRKNRKSTKNGKIKTYKLNCIL